MWSKWETNRFFDELTRVERIKGQTASRGRALFAAHTRRPVLYEGLSLCDPGKWLKVEELVRSMVSSGLDFEVARYAWKLYVGDAEYGCLDGIGGNAMVKLRYVLCFLFEYAATLGIIDVAYIHPDDARSDYHKLWGWSMYGGGTFLSRYDGLQYIRINPLGALPWKWPLPMRPDLVRSGRFSRSFRTMMWSLPMHPACLPATDFSLIRLART